MQNYILATKLLNIVILPTEKLTEKEIYKNSHPSVLWASSVVVPDKQHANTKLCEAD
jgi:hypothetical protein